MITYMQKNFTKGFTLIEALVAIFIFGIVMTGAISILVSSLNSQKYVLASQKLANETSLLMESWSRVLREAQKEDGATPNCLAADSNYKSVSADTLFFLDADNICRELFYDAGAKQIREYVSTDDDALHFNLAFPNDVTPKGISVEKLRFVLRGETGGDSVQPRVTIYIEAVAKGFPSNPPRIQIQTTISQRNLDE